MHLSWPLHYKLLLSHQASTQGFLETPTLKALAQTGSNPGQVCCYQECSPHTQPGDSSTEKWEALPDTMYGTALATFGKRSSKSHDWVGAKSSVIIPTVKPSELPSQSTNELPMRGTYRFSGLPGARLSGLLDAAQTNTGQNSARTSSLPP